MKKINSLLLFLAFSLGALWANDNHAKLTEDFLHGNPNIKSINALAFGPEGILFLGDSKTANVVAIDTEDNRAKADVEAIKMEKIDEQIASLLGTTADAITIQDMAVNQVSKMIYIAVHLQDGTPILLKTNGQKWQHLPLTNVHFSKMGLRNPVEANAEDKRGRPLRIWAISDLTFYKGRVMVTGLSNEEFSSTFRSIPFPFKEEQNLSSLEIYHAAHGRYETYAPIKTFLPFDLNGSPHLIASYTCTPLVIFPLSDLKPGKHIKGRTVAELGNWNTPLDIIPFTKEGKTYLYLANSNRALMRLDPEQIEDFKASLTKPVDRYDTAGVEFIALPFVNVQQLDKLGESEILLIQRTSSGNLNMFTAPKHQI